MPWFDKEQIQPRANFRETVGMKRWAEQVEGTSARSRARRSASTSGDLNMEKAIQETFPETEFVDGYQAS